MSGLLHSKRWELLPCSGKDERLLCRELGISPLVARVLCARGIGEVDDAREFLNPSLERDWADPLDIPGMADAAQRVQDAIAAGERIAVFGDFDVDGMTSTCLLTLGLRDFGADVHPYIPHRFGEGYGLSHEALNRVIEGCDPDLVITVDNGIASGKEVAWLKGLGIDVVITDHHEPSDHVPEGVPVTDPKLEPNCYSRELAGVGVALKLVCELGRRLGKPELWKRYTDLAAMGTVSDMMVLQGENRSLVADGIERMRRSTRPGLVALAATAGIDLSQVNADDLPFSLIPRLNAAGRMGTTETAFDLLISADYAQAVELAGALEHINTQRRETEAALSDDALGRLKESYDGERVIVLAGEGWHEGVKGIVASRVVNRYHVPTIIFTLSDGIARGSGRSVGSVDLFHAVEQCSDLLVRFGGHAGAVGVTCEIDKLDAFRARLQQVMDRLPEEDFVDKGEVAALVSLDELNYNNIAELDRLQPFGQGNKRPLLGIQGVFMKNRTRVGYENAHLRFLATDGVNSMPAIMFRTPNIERASSCEGLVDLVVDAINESWQGRTNPKLMVSDILYRDAMDDGCGSGRFIEEDVHDRDFSECAAVDGEARSTCEGMSEAMLTERIREHLIGTNELLPAQREALQLLSDGKSTLCVMATGRGKSLIFHLHAARMALLNRKASVFVYPLRALVSDQAFHLQESLGSLGLRVSVLTGETAMDAREQAYEDLCQRRLDVVLTTPEYLALHAKSLARCGRVGFLVVDEAHHAGAQGGNRDAYAQLGRVRAGLGDPVTLAVTATASDEVANNICQSLGIRKENVVVDRTVRENLRIADYRELRERDVYLASMVSSGSKTVVYVNSRSQASSVARDLRQKVPELGQSIAFYHAGLSRDVRHKVEEAFRDDRLSCIVCTSAFGEGVNLPSIRNVVLYHMPFGSTEFNQLSGRAGRDGAEASVHLLYGKRDAQVNERILLAQAPVRDDLATLYRALMTANNRSSDGVFPVDEAAVLQMAMSIDERANLTESAVDAGVAIFEELGFCSVEGYGDQRKIHMAHSPHHVDLSDSLRYTEGMRAIEEFESFRDWALLSAPQEMLSCINRPIAPDFGRTVDR